VVWGVFDLAIKYQLFVYLLALISNLNFSIVFINGENLYDRVLLTNKRYYYKSQTKQI